MRSTPTPGDLHAAPSRPRPTVLLIEDNEDNRTVYEAYLAYAGYEVLTTEDAESGLALVRERRPDLVVMDVGLPGMDGYAATRLLKDDPATRAIPVIILTAHAQAVDRERALAAGCDRFLTKPLEPRQLGREIGGILRPGDEAGP